MAMAVVVVLAVVVKVLAVVVNLFTSEAEGVLCVTAGW